MSITPATATHTEPLPAGGLWDYVSPSRLSLWLRCPLAFRFRYLDRLVTPATPSLLVGKAVHAGLEYFYRHQEQGTPVTAERIARWMRDDWRDFVAGEASDKQAATSQAALCEQAIALVHAYLRQRPTDDGQPRFVEQTFRAPLIDPSSGEDLGLDLVGIVDLVLRESEGPRICDFKTQAKASPPNPMTHEVQLTAYAYLVRQAIGQTETALEIRSLVKTKTPQLQRHVYPPRSEQSMRRFFAAVRCYLDDLERGRFVYRPGWTCSFCEYRGGPCTDWLGDQ